MAGRSLRASMERARRIWPAMQSPPRCSVALFSQRDFIAPVVGVSRTNLRFPKILLPIPESGLVGCAVVLRASGGASAIALIGSGSGSARNIVIALTPAISPHTTNTRNPRAKLGVPIYPNSGCSSRTWAEQSALCPQTPSIMTKERSHANYITVNDTRPYRG